MEDSRQANRIAEEKTDCRKAIQEVEELSKKLSYLQALADHVTGRQKEAHDLQRKSFAFSKS